MTSGGRLGLAALGLAVFVFLCFAAPNLAHGFDASEAARDFVYHSDGAGDVRNHYSWRVLEMALERTKPNYGPYHLVASKVIEEGPKAYALQHHTGGITLSVFTARSEYGGSLIPVRIPIDRGMLGYRVLLVHRDLVPRLAQVTTLGDLAAIRFGSKTGWADSTILRNAGLRVVMGDSFDGMFRMLVNRRFDALGRGAGEALRETKEKEAELPDIVIEPHLLLVYPMPVYFWFNKDEAGRLRAERVRAGLALMIADGGLDKLFAEEFGPVLATLDFAHRQVIRLDNPFLGPEDPLWDERYWFRPDLGK